jgi:hypothetical protein
MWLYSFGPSISTDDVVYHSVAPVSDAGESDLSIRQGETGDEALEEARRHAADTEPEVFTAERREGPITVHGRFERYGAAKND